jgi:hypothetical protein
MDCHPSIEYGSAREAGRRGTVIQLSTYCTYLSEGLRAQCVHNMEGNALLSVPGWEEWRRGGGEEEASRYWDWKGIQHNKRRRRQE